MVLATTDNRNRTAGQVRSVFTKYGANLGDSGGVAWQFEQRGSINVPAIGLDSDDLALAAIDAGALDVEIGGEMVTVYTTVTDFQRVKAVLEAGGFDTGDSELAMIPTAPIQLDDRQTVQVLKFIDVLEELDDVDQVYTNVEFTDAAIEQFEAA